MRRNRRGVENPRQSKFCKGSGISFRVTLRCSHCGFENPEGSIFRTECGERLSKPQKLLKGAQRKCKNCGHFFNELDTLHCVACGKEMIKKSKEGFKRQSVGPSYKMIALVIGTVLLLFFPLSSCRHLLKERGYRNYL